MRVWEYIQPGVYLPCLSSPHVMPTCINPPALWRRPCPPAYRSIRSKRPGISTSWPSPGPRKCWRSPIPSSPTRHAAAKSSTPCRHFPPSGLLAWRFWASTFINAAKKKGRKSLESSINSTPARHESKKEFAGQIPGLLVYRPI